MTAKDLRIIYHCTNDDAPFAPDFSLEPYDDDGTKKYIEYLEEQILNKDKLIDVSTKDGVKFIPKSDI